MAKSNATHVWMADGVEIEVACNGGNVYLPADDQADPSVQPKATYEVADYDEEGREEWIVLVGGRATKGKLVPIGTVAVKVDEENNAEEWWDALRSYDRAHGGGRTIEKAIDSGSVTPEQLEILKALPGWADGPEFARTALVVDA